MNRKEIQTEIDFDLPLDEQKVEKSKKIEDERNILLSRISSYQVDSITEKVAWVLNNYPETRNSDITLQIKYWEHFNLELFSGDFIQVKDLYQLTRLTTITRARAKIQNTLRLYLADEGIRKQRGTLQEEEKEKAINADTFPFIYTVYSDESGKTGKFLIVGSMWVLEPKQGFSITSGIINLKDKESFQGEFHFTDINKYNLGTYKKLADLVGEKSAFLGFKAVCVEKKGISNIQNAFTDLYYHLLIKGIEHENKTGRATLPRTISFWKDLEEEGADKLLINNLIDKLKNAAKSQLNDKLKIGDFNTVNSKGNSLIQIGDLFTSSINRLINEKSENTKPKDEFALYFLKNVGIDTNEPIVGSNSDMAVSFYL